MGSKERLQQSVGLRREDILAAARRIFVRNGMAGTRMEDIAAEAEYTKRTLYRYFSSREQLLLTLLLAEQHRLNGYFEAAAARPGNGMARIYFIGERFVRYFFEEPDSFSLLTMPAELFTLQGEAEKALIGEIVAKGMEMHRFIADIFRAGIADGSVRADVDPHLATLYVVSVTTGMLQTVGRSGGRFETIHGLSSREFAAYCLKNLGAAFAAAPCCQGEAT